MRHNKNLALFVNLAFDLYIIFSHFLNFLLLCLTAGETSKDFEKRARVYPGSRGYEQIVCFDCLETSKFVLVA